MNFLDSLFGHLREGWPFVRITPWERGIRIRYWGIPWTRWKAVTVQVLGPGVHFAFWWFEEILTESVVQQVRNLPTQSVTTKDDIAVSFSTNVSYEVVDVEANLTQVHDFETSMVNLAMMHLSERVRDKTWEDLLHNMDDLERSLKGTLTTRVKPWGVRIVDVTLTDLVRARAYRLLGDPILK